ncbi:sulfotransferase [Herbaspirillum sp. AP02]|nr:MULTISPECIES: tetratricopeptide repeat-containing sulfotransferase family protein [unclassified Herbaspirillum]MBG7621015.1 sulfotransferase [Herbaspirillum sp. AP02]NZD68744.1 sulfotransferase [Herbaspirillum sp. AP21]
MDSNNFPYAEQLTIQQALQRAYAHWNAGQAPQAEQLCLRVLQVIPQQPDALNLLAVMAHAYGKLDMAVDFLRRACQHPETPASYLSNLAEMCRQKGLLAEAEQAAQRAVKIDPGLVAGWSNLGIILQESGKLDESLVCLEKVAALQPENAQSHNNLANTCKRLGLLERAQAAYQKALALNPGYAEAHSNLAFLLTEQGRFDEAVAAGRAAIELNPQLADAYLNLAEVEISRSRNDAALQWLNALLSFAPKHPGGLSALAQVLDKAGRGEEALAAARDAVAVSPDNANAHHVLGLRLQSMGQHEAALAEFRQAAALPGTVAEDALISIANAHLENGDKEAAIAAFAHALQTYPGSTKAMAARIDTRKFRADDPDIAAMEAALAVTPPPGISIRMNLHFALGKAYLDTGESALAFEHLNRGNAIKRATFSYDGAAVSAWMQRITDTFTPELMQRLSAGGASSDLPVFIIGMPRSGTTLVEQILASHPDIHGAGELSALRHAVDRAVVFPDKVAHLDAAALQRIGEDYLAQVRPLAPHAARVVDKMPANFLHAGLIPLILSGARIIHCRRDPVDTCLSCYSKHFAGEQLFSYQMDELGQFYRAYQDLMAHLRQVLPPERFIEVDYEAVVDDLEGQARRLIDFTGLPWNDACLAFHETRRIVRTASVAQVRQPIYTSSKGRWRQHEAHLGPLLAALAMEQQ